MSETDVDRLVNFFENFAPQDLARLGDIYAQDAAFKDPFNDVQGIEAVRRVYAHMFETLDAPRFTVTTRTAQGEACWLAWDFRFRIRSWKPEREQLVRGASHLQLAPDGRIRVHRDYWDAAEELYEKLPVIGALMRALRRRMAS